MKHKLLTTYPLYGIILMLLWVTPLMAQDRVVSGKVTSEADNQPLIGVNVILKGTTSGTVTDIDGNYSINISSSDAVLVFSFIGYTSTERRVGDQQTINLSMAEDITSLSEVVVVGYGTQEKKDLTGAVSVVKPEEVQKRQATTVGEALQGLATGVRVRGGARPGSEANVTIRGIKNLSNSNPLYVIDGLITTANRDFNPNDIESIQILKDASAAAIYGSRAANGVIIITTKKGKQGPMEVNFSSKTSLTTMPLYDLAGTEEFTRLNYMAYDNAGKERQQLETQYDTDWQDEAFQTGNIQDYNISFSGGSENATYYVSGNYFTNKGTVIDTRFDRYTFRVNTNTKKGIFSIGENLAISNARADEMSGNPIVDVIRLLPTIPVYDDSHPGGYGYGDEAKARTFATNPVALADLEDRTNENLRIRGNIWSELKPVEFLTYRFNLGYETSSDHYKYLRKVGNWTLNQPTDPSIIDQNRARYESVLVENTLTFNKTFGDHVFNLVVGQTYQKDNYGQISGQKRNILVNPTTGAYYDVLDQGNTPVARGFENASVILSYLGRLEYSYKDKYLLNAVLRRDGSSRLAPDNKWKTFPSVSAAWRFSDESFFETVPFISDAKLRASYGQLGSGNIGPYEYIPTINTFGTIAMGQGQNVLPSAIQVQLANQDLRWETLTQKNVGLDLGFLDNKLTVTAEYFDAKTADVLFGYPIPDYTGNDGGNPVVNGATVQNRGFEFSATYRQAGKSFNYWATANLTTLNNQIVKLGYGLNRALVGNTITELGEPVGMWYVLETDGLFQSQQEINDYKNSEGTIIQPDAQPGDIRFVDNNDDGFITNADKEVVGSPWADFELGLNMGATYKNFELTMNWFGSFGATVFNGPKSVTDRFDDNSNYRSGVQPWTPENTDTDFPRVVYASTLNARGDTERWLESGTFFRLKYISLSYSLPTALMAKIGFNSAQVSISGQNLLTFTGYDGLDPEFNNSSIFEKGFDFGAFPNVKMYSLGVQFGF